jgi:TetR/AcrR family transcriptional regulator, cholesterol catabolism regulator
VFLFCTFAAIKNMTAELKESILKKAEILFFKYGVKSVTMDDIARELGMSKKTLYQFFENKIDMLSQMTDHQMVQDRLALASLKGHSKNALEELLGFARHALKEISKFTSPTIIFDLQKYYPEIWKKFEDFQDEIIYKFVKENIDRGISESLYRDDLDADIIAKLYVTKTMCVIDEEMFPTRQYDKVKLFKQYFYYHIRGIATTKGLKLLEKYISEFTPEKPI